MNIISFKIINRENYVIFWFYTDLLWFPTDCDFGEFKQFKKDILNHNCNQNHVKYRQKRFIDAERILKRLER